MRMRTTVLAISFAASSLTLTASLCWPAEQQSEAKSEESARPSGTDTELKDKISKKRIVENPDGETPADRLPGINGLARQFVSDQEQIWKSPAKIRFSDTQWLVPASGIAAGVFITGSDYSKHPSHNSNTTSHYKTLSNAGVGALIGGAGRIGLLGHVRHNEHWSETGFLAGEAALNSLRAGAGIQ